MEHVVTVGHMYIQVPITSKDLKGIEPGTSSSPEVSYTTRLFALQRREKVWNHRSKSWSGVIVLRVHHDIPSTSGSPEVGVTAKPFYPVGVKGMEP